MAKKTLTKEALIKLRLINDESVAKILSRYNNEPAVFLQQAPSDKDRGWDDEKQYPRIEFNLSSAYAPEREQSGSLTIDIVCSQLGPTPEEIEPIVRQSLTGVFYFPEEGYPINLIWKNTVGFTDSHDEAGNTMRYGLSLTFDVNMFPSMQVAEPDPVAALNNFFDKMMPDIVVIGVHNEVGYVVPTREKPVVWVRRISTSMDRETYACEWLVSRLAIHVFAPKIIDRQQWIDQIQRFIDLKGEVTMLDGSPMLVESDDWNFAADEINGQLQISFSYGRLKKVFYVETLGHVKQEVIENE